MQLVENGPDIPNPLVNDLMNDRAVLFCGAGVSRNEGLPDFNKLAATAVGLLEGAPASVASKHLKYQRYDAALQVVYDEIEPSDLAQLLNDELTFKGASLKAHKTILGLATERNSNRVRLVTTNLDHGFSKAADPSNIKQDVAPRLPPVRKDWWTTVALHGQLENDNIDNLVLTSGQFGRAYMTEGWATRFVAELFRRFVVVFVGYSVDDPVMRYIVDSYRAVDPVVEEMPTYAFVGSSKTKKDCVIAEWRTKHVKQIWYPAEDDDHQILYDSLEELRRLKEKGRAAPQVVLDRYCRGSADSLTAEEISQVDWALKEIRGRGLASQSSELPSDGVLSALSRRSPRAADSWFKLLRKLKLEPEFLLVERWPRLGSEIRHRGAFEEHRAAGEWISKQLRSKPLIDWVIGEGGFISPAAAEVISPHVAGEPGPFERAWRFMCDVAVSSPYWTVNVNSLAFESHSVDEQADALIATILPAIRLEHGYLTSEDDIECARDLIQPGISLPVDKSPVQCVERILKENECAEILHRAAQRLLARLDDLGNVLRRIQEGLGEIPYEVVSDPDKLYLPSSNSSGHAWRLIPILVNKVTDYLCKTDRTAFGERVRQWLIVPHSIVHTRIAFRVLSKNPLIEPGILVESLERFPNWLCDDALRTHFQHVLSTFDSLLSPSHRKTIGRLVLEWSQKPSVVVKEIDSDELLASKAREAIELLSTLHGDADEVLRRFPVLSRYRSCSKEQDRLHHSAHAYGSAQRSLSFDFRTERLDGIASGIESDRIIRSRFIEWTAANGTKKAFKLVERYSSDTVVKASLSGISRWLSEHQGTTVGANRALSLVESLEESSLSSILSETTRALRGICGVRRHPARARILDQIDRCIKLSIHVEEDPPGEPIELVTDAINSDVGKLAESLMELLPKRVNAKNGSVRKDALSRLDQMLTHSKLTRARVGLILGHHLSYLYSLDREWCERCVLSLLTDSHPRVKRYTWYGFLSNPRLTPPSLACYLVGNLKTAVQSTKQVEMAQPNLGRLPLLLHYYYPQKLDAAALRDILKLMNPPTLAESIRGIVELLPGDGELEDTWSKWIRGALEKGFPAVSKCYGKETSLAFVEFIIALEPVADEIIKIISSHLTPVDQLSEAIHMLREKDSFIENHPAVSLRLVRKIVAPKPTARDAHELSNFLKDIGNQQSIRINKDYRYLNDLAQQT